MGQRYKRVKSGTLYATYRLRCRNNNTFFDIPIEDFEKLIKQNCHYCDRPPSNHKEGLIYSGLDRKNNKKGYYLNNVVPCCKHCNFAKADYYTYEEMLEIGKILRKIREKRL